MYLLTGADRPKIETAIARLRRHFAVEAVEHVSALEVSGVEAVALCNAGSLFGDARLVLVTEVDGRRRDDGRLSGGWKAADVDEVAAYCAAPAPATVLALVASDLKKDAKLAKVCAKAGSVLEFTVAKRSLVPWVQEQFRRRGVAADAEACAALVHIVRDGDLHALAAEIDKIATWADGEPVGEREVRDLAVHGEPAVFELTDALARREPGRVLGVSEEILQRSHRSPRDESARLAAALVGHVAKLKTAQRLAGEGVRAGDALAKLGTRSRYYADKLYTQAAAFSPEELHDATVRLAALDVALKGGSRLAADLQVQRALVDLSRPPGTPPARR